MFAFIYLPIYYSIYENFWMDFHQFSKKVLTNEFPMLLVFYGFSLVT